MSWMDLDDKLLDHPKFIRAVKRGGSEVVHLWLGLRQYVAQQLTDGFIPEDMVDEVRGPHGRKREQALAVLREVGLVEDTDGGVQLHDFLQWSKSRDQILKQREANRLRQAKSRDRNAVTDTVTHADVTPSVTLPSPLHTTPHQSEPPSGVTREARSRPKGTRLVPESWAPKPEHVNLAMQLGVPLEPESQKFRDHEFYRTITDWDRAFSNWIRRSIELKRVAIAAKTGDRGADQLERQMARISALEAQEAKALP